MESLTWVLSFYLDLDLELAHGLNEELGRHSSRNSSKACVFCECECESVEHVLWECSEYSSICKEFKKNLDGFL